MKKETFVVMALLVLFSIAIGVTQRTPTQQGMSVSFLSENQVAVVDLYGPIAFSASSAFGPTGANGVLDELNRIREDKDVNAVILRINSPGGTVGASQELYDQVLRIKDELNIPVISSIGDIGASGAYYVALASDKIYANPGSLVGSIGVIMGNINFSQLAEKYGVDFSVFKSGKYKDTLSGWRDPTSDEEDLLQGLVDNVHQQFVSVLIEERGLTDDEAKAIAQGQVFSGQQALENKLIDDVGSFEDVVEFVSTLEGVGSNPKLISKRSDSLEDLFRRWESRLGVSSWFKSHPTLEF